MLLDAYAVRKAIPRIVLAVIGINLSIYLCVAAVDVTTIIGRGIGGLLTTPFVKGNNYDFFIEGNVENAAALIGGAGIFVAAGGLGAATAGIISAATAPLATLGTLLILLIPVALVALAVLATLVIRQALLIFLIIVSPVAIACFVLPGTEKYFRQWLDLFAKTLMVYPIIAVIFAMSDVMGSIIFTSASGGNDISQPVKIITGILVIYAPLVLIPFAFRFAGGVIGRVAAIATTGAQKVSEVGPIKGRREIAKRDWSNQQIQNRADIAGRLQTYGSRNRSGIRGRVTNRAIKGLAGSIGGYNIEEQASAARAQMGKVLGDQIATGRDEEIRGLTVNKKVANQGGMQAAAAADGNTYSTNGLRRVTSSGARQYQTLGGAWVDEAHVDAGYSRWGNDTFAQQAALSYEMRKAASDEQVEGIGTRYQALATGDGGWGMSSGEAVGALKGAGFENQGTHLEFKHMKLDGTVDYDGMAQEIYEKKGSYPLANMSAHTAKQLMRAYDDPGASQARKDQIRSISQTFMQRGLGGQIGDQDDTPIRAPGGGREPMFNASGAGHVNEAYRELARRTGVITPGGAPSNQYGNPNDTGNSTPGAKQT